jgi:hypothetical protein
VVNPGNVLAEALAQVNGRSVQTQPVGVRPEVQLVPLRKALEALVRVLANVDGERAALGAFRAMHGAGAATLVAARFRRVEVQQLKDLLHRDSGSNGAKVDPRHRCGSIMGRDFRDPQRTRDVRKKTAREEESVLRLTAVEFRKPADPLKEKPLQDILQMANETLPGEMSWSVFWSGTRTA